MTVTTSGGVPATRPRRQLLVILLIVSAVLNLCFIGGVVWMRMHAPPHPAERMQAIAGQLGLSEPQRTGFERYFRTMRARFQLMRTELDPLVTDAWAEIAKPQPDAAKIEQDFEAAATKRRAFAHEATDNTLVFLATLSPEQRTKFVALLRENRALWLQR